MRLKAQPTLLASALASIVLPTPGTSSIRTWPWHSKAMRASSTSPCLPTMTRSTLATIVSATDLRSSTIGRSQRTPSQIVSPTCRQPSIAASGQWSVVSGPLLAALAVAQLAAGHWPLATAFGGDPERVEAGGVVLVEGLARGAGRRLHGG